MCVLCKLLWVQIPESFESNKIPLAVLVSFPDLGLALLSRQGSEEARGEGGVCNSVGQSSFEFSFVLDTAPRCCGYLRWQVTPKLEPETVCRKSPCPAVAEF